MDRSGPPEPPPSGAPVSYLHELDDARPNELPPPAEARPNEPPPPAAEPAPSSAAGNVFDVYGGVASGEVTQAEAAGRSVLESVHTVVDSLVVPAVSGVTERLRGGGRSRGARFAVRGAVLVVVGMVAAGLLVHPTGHATKPPSAKPEPRALAARRTESPKAAAAAARPVTTRKPHPRPAPRKRAAPIAHHRARPHPRPHRRVPTRRVKTRRKSRPPVRRSAPAVRATPPAQVAPPPPPPVAAPMPRAPAHPSRPRGAGGDEFGFER